MANTKSPTSIDRHVGMRIGMQRRPLGISRHRLAKMIGVAVYQVQKYEAGTNRVFASRLQQIALALRVRTSILLRRSADSEQRAKSISPIKEFVCSPQGIALSRAFAKISDRQMRSILVTLVEPIADR
jgi:transcriptional regulator with XRE-family HTH domain